jgi:hypothetical protein
VQARRRARDVALVQQGVERDQQVQVEAGDIVQTNGSYLEDSFPIYRAPAQTAGIAANQRKEHAP